MGGIYEAVYSTFIFADHWYLILIKPPPALLPQPAGIHHIAQQHAGPVLGVARLSVQHLHDGQARVEADKVGQLERAHGHVGAVLHDGVDGVAVADARLEADDGLVDIRHEDAVGQEAGRVGRHRGDLAEALAKGDGGVERGLRRLQAADDLDALLHGHGVHKVRRDDAGAVGRVGGVLGGGGGDARDGDGRRVGGQDGVLGADLGELGEDVKLELGDLGDGLDDEVDVGEGVDGGCWGEEGARSVGLLLGDAVLGDVFGEELFWRGRYVSGACLLLGSGGGQPTGKANALVQGVLRRVDERNGHLGLYGGHEGNPQALCSRKDHGQRRTVVDLNSRGGSPSGPRRRLPIASRLYSHSPRTSWC